MNIAPEQKIKHVKIEGEMAEYVEKEAKKNFRKPTEQVRYMLQLARTDIEKKRSDHGPDAA